MKTRAFNQITIIILIAVAVTSGFHFLSKKNSFLEKLKKASTSGQERIAIAELTPFRWSKICLLPPYSIAPHTKKKDVQNELGVLIRNIDQIPILNDDSAWGMVFLKGDVVVKTYVTSDFQFTSRIPTCADENAIFQISNGKITINQGIAK